MSWPGFEGWHARVQMRDRDLGLAAYRCNDPRALQGEVDIVGGVAAVLAAPDAVNATPSPATWL